MQHTSIWVICGTLLIAQALPAEVCAVLGVVALIFAFVTSRREAKQEAQLFGMLEKISANSEITEITIDD